MWGLLHGEEKYLMRDQQPFLILTLPFNLLKMSKCETDCVLVIPNMGET